MRKFAIIIAMLLLLCSCRKLEEESIETTAQTELQTEIITEIKTEPATEIETEPPVDTTNDGIVSILMAGDVLLHDKVANSGKMNDGTYNYDHMF